MPRKVGKKSINEYLTSEVSGCVYKLSYGNDFYVGSTVRPLKKRLYDHREKYKTGKCKLYQMF